MVASRPVGVKLTDQMNGSDGATPQPSPSPSPSPKPVPFPAASLVVTISSPVDGASVQEPQRGAPIQVGGTLEEVNGYELSECAVVVKIGGESFMGSVWQPPKNPSPSSWFWDCEVPVATPGQKMLIALGTGIAFDPGDFHRPVSSDASVTVQVPDTVAPTVQILQPSNMQSIPVDEGGSNMLLKVRATDYLGMRSVEWSRDGGTYSAATRDSLNFAEWVATITIPALPLGNHTVSVRATDLTGNAATQAVTFVASDTTPPHFRLDRPAQDQPFVLESGACSVRVEGGAWDNQSGMSGGQAGVAWSLNGQLPFTPAKTSNNWAKWQADVPITAYGAHVIQLRFIDAAGNSIIYLLNVRVIRSDQPRDLASRLSPQAYLEDVLRFARDHVQVPIDGSLSSNKLSATFYQPFGALSQEYTGIGNQPVNRLRVPIEALRRHLYTQLENMVARWTFDPETIAGTKISDTSGNGNVAEVFGTLTPADGWQEGKALNFDGATQYARVNHSSILELGKDNADFSVAFAVNLLQNAGSTTRLLVQKGTSMAQLTFSVFVSGPDNRLYARISTSANPNEGIAASAAALPLNAWTHVTYVKAGDELRLYINGVLDSRVILSGPVVSNTGPIYLGKAPWSAGAQCRLDDVRLYRFALAEQSIRVLAGGVSSYVGATLSDQAEAVYRQRAYEALLIGLGTSYTELRLARGAARQERESLARRLGVRLGASAPDELDQLTLDSQHLTEATLEELFGLPDSIVCATSKEVRTPARPRLLDWQLASLRTGWLEQDQSASAASRPWPVVIEPDLIGPEDLRDPVPTNLVPRILAARQTEVQAMFDGLGRSLAAYWSFEPETIAGSKVSDASGNGNSAEVIGGLTLVEGLRGGKALAFDGTTQYARVAHTPTLALGMDNADFSMTFSVNLLQGATGAWRVLAHKGASGNERICSIWLPPDSNRLHARISTTANPNEGVDSVAELPLNTWTHVAYVKAGNELRLYINGVLDSHLTLHGAVVGNSGPLYLAKDLWWAGVKCSLDDVSLYPFAISSGVVRALAAFQSSSSPAAAQAEARFQGMLACALPALDLAALDSQLRQGVNIVPALSQSGLSREMFARLVRLSELAAAGDLTDDEWTDARHILTQVTKTRRFADWQLEEAAIGLTPEHFQVSPVERSLPPWRATREARQDWQDTLQARIDQQFSLGCAAADNVAAAEEGSLPLLRDAIVSAFVAADSGDQVQDDLSDRLLIDIKGDGSLRTTRTLQASETLQNLIFSLRTSRLTASHPAESWTITNPDDDEERFDTEWQWMGSYPTWSAAMSIVLMPENVLMPSLRADQTSAFADLLRELRARPRLTPDDARTLAVHYLATGLDGMQRGLAVGEGGLPAPLAWWKLHEGSGSTANDASGNNNRGTWNLPGPTWSDGYFGQALKFDGVANRVTISAGTTLEQLQDTFTLAFWVKPRATHQIDDQATTGVSGDTGQRYVLGPAQRGSSGAGVGVSVGTNGVSVYEVAATPPAAPSYWPALLVYQAPILDWTHVAIVYQDRKPSLYVNGRLVRKRVEASSQAHVLARPDGLGGVSAGYFQGLLEDVRIYTQALTPEQIDLLALTLTDRRTEADLIRLGALSQRLLKPYKNAAAGPPYLGESTPAFLQEALFFVPLQLAMQLQKAGEFVAALDWYQTIYTHTLPPADRKVYYGLDLEQNRAYTLAGGAHWAREWLDVHRLALSRPNPYTRFVLMSIARCFLEFADSEFTRDTGESRARATALYASTRELLGLADLQTPVPERPEQVSLPNPTLDALIGRAELQLAKLRQGRNIAGMKRAVEPLPVPATASAATLPSADGLAQLAAASAVELRPTPYRYRVLIERSKQLVGLAEQIESAYLAAMEKYDEKQYRRFEANKGLDLANAGVDLQALRVTEASRGVTLAQKQENRANFLKTEYGDLIRAGLSEYERDMIEAYQTTGTARIMAAYFDTGAQLAQASVSSSAWGAAALPVLGVMTAGRYMATAVATQAETNAQIASVRASFERRVEEWQLQRGVAEQDSLIAEEQGRLAQDHESIAKQEEKISRIQLDQARRTVEFLDGQFTNPELYEWMSEVLGSVYGYFLQQATATARLAQSQLAFERQEAPTAFIRADYWQPPAEGAVAANGDTHDRRGLTGSARLLQDISQLDQYAFESDKRRLNLSQTFSLAQVAPQEFQRFRETGVLTFATPMQWFDRSFPGHYLRLIKRIRTSVVALIPPNQGIRATLTASGVSRVVVGGDVFRETVIRRDPELVALTSPVGATGVFELDVQSDMLLPFEAMGVDTTWELQMPKAANAFDYRTLADVLLTIDYTALSSPDYRQQVIQRLDRRVEGERSISIRDELPDLWYDLNNPDQSSTPLTIAFTTERDDFPPNVEPLQVAHVLLYVARAVDESAPVELTHLHFTPLGGDANAPLGGAAVVGGDGIVSTRRGSWGNLCGAPVPPIGTWEVKFAPSAQPLLSTGRIDDMLLVVTYKGRLPAWPA